MKGQNFSFMETYPNGKKIDDILFTTKRITNRVATDFRKKLDKGGIMHCFTKLRTKNARRLGDAIVIETSLWKPSEIPSIREIKDIKSPIKRFNWYQFITLDGFESFDNFKSYFTKGNKSSKEFIAYYFRKLKNLINFNQ